MLNYRLGTVVKLSEGSEKGGGNCHLFFLLAESRIVRFFGRAGESLLLLSHPKFIFCFSLPLQYRYMKNNNSSVSLSWFYSCVCQKLHGDIKIGEHGRLSGTVLQHISKRSVQRQHYYLGSTLHFFLSKVNLGLTQIIFIQSLKFLHSKV